MPTQPLELISRHEIAEVDAVAITHGGAGYASAPVVTIAGAAAGTSTLDAVDTDAVGSVALTAKGRYAFSDPPAVTFADPGTGNDVATGRATMARTNRPCELVSELSLAAGSHLLQNVGGGTVYLAEASAAPADLASIQDGHPIAPGERLGITVAAGMLIYIWSQGAGRIVTTPSA